MSYYNWEEIFKSKSNKELTEIYKGKTHLGFDAPFYAIFELNSRGVQIENHKEYISQSIQKLEMNIEEHKNFAFNNSKYFRSFILSIAFVILIIVILVSNKDEIINKPDAGNLSIFIKLLGGLLAVFVGYLNYFIYKKDLAKTIETKKKLLKRLLSLYTQE